ncbi:FAD-dependent oxidoreductase [Castellaniella sp. GW247-6E4]|uniref:FAD-dependent oxidoreductase n=1 Tax=Castellaniella sp. GW247-6E4 TaxID=3140380 RepID=UPI0033156877
MTQIQTHSGQEQADVLVFGTGAAGLTAALVAAVEGLEVRVFEKSAFAGGTTATSGGSLWVPGTAQTLRDTPEATVDLARKYLLGELGDWVRHDLLDAFLAASPEAIDYLAQHSAVQFAHATNPDYHADAPFGSATGHAITALPFDARRLGADFARLKPPRDVFMVLGGMMVGRREIPMLLRPFSSVANFRRTVSLLAGYARDRLRYPRGTRLLIGNALIARYMYSLRQRGVSIDYETRLVELHREDGRVAGAVVERAGRRWLVRARRGVVLATGGIAHSKPLRAEWMAAHPHDHSMADEGDTGDGVTVARSAGAKVDAAVSNPAYWSPASIRQREDGSRTLWIHGHMDRGKPGLMAVGASGRRFVNEADSYHDFVLAMFGGDGRAPIPSAYLICDHRFIRKYGLGLVRPLISRIEPFVRDGYLIRADSIEALAERAGIDPLALRETVATYNVDAQQGDDSQFGRGSRILNRFNGDPAHRPNPCMSPIAHPPYYALKVHPCTIGTTIGLATDADARVLDENDNPMPGLYACGNDISSVFRGFYPGPGATLGAAVVFAYRAARHLAVGSGDATLSG